MLIPLSEHPLDMLREKNDDPHRGLLLVNMFFLLRSSFVSSVMNILIYISFSIFVITIISITHETQKCLAV
jgi:hypothetical protein